ncbi:MAG: antibiotic biosynthesis monooxygenase [Acidobacteria bacterium]|nr:MAG: antibiotic biosynthesis monooxygenase [Acidobacteriota bacterium]
MDERVTVLARVHARVGREAEVRGLLLTLVAPSRAEAGCINYDLHQSADDPTEFMFYENWTRRAALDAHLDMPYLNEFDALAEELLAEPVEITFWQMISAASIEKATNPNG